MRSRHHARRPTILLATLGATVLLPPPLSAQQIFWDDFGVPHIYANDVGALAYGYGWAQAQSHGDLLLRLYGQARGRAAEYWGERFVESDQWVRVNGVPQRARAWLADATAEERALIDGFVAGVNAYAAAHPDALDDAMEQVLPLAPEDVLAHAQRVVHFTFIVSPQVLASVGEELGAGRGSNAWAVGPARSASGDALLLLNPHLPWGDLFTWYEAHLVGGGLEAYGVSLLGMPVINMGFNRRLGWTHTVNTHDGADTYALTLRGNGYEWDGGVRAFDVRHDTIRVRTADGSIDARPFDVVSSVHGPIIARSGERAVALRVAGLDRPHLLGQTVAMLRAQNLEEFQAAVRMLQIPMFTIMYADADGHIMSLFNGVVPRRPQGDFARWTTTLPGDTSAWLWSETLTYEELPRVVDPETGWLQNANEPPWTTTLPMALEPAEYAPYIAPPPMLPLRPQSSITLLRSDATMTLEELIELKHSTRMMLAVRILDDLTELAAGSDDADVRAAVEVLARWDQHANADSRGAVLFIEFWNRYREHAGQPLFGEPWSAADPLATPDGLADPQLARRALAEAARAVRAAHGALDVAFGDVYRLRAPGVDLPANGFTDAFGVFRATGYAEAEDGTPVARFGDSFVAAIEFGDTVHARALLGYGNATEPGIRSANQLELYARRQLRPIWFSREAVEQNAVRREQLDSSVDANDSRDRR